MENSNTKETINLLDLLSDTESDISDLVLMPKKKKMKRKHRPGSTVKMKHSNCCGCSKSDMRIISLWLAAVLVTFWLIALSWLATILYGEIKRMDVSIKTARSGRKCRGRRSRACPGFLKACSAFLACASVLATTSLIWLFIDVRQQLTALRTELDQVIAGNEGVPDALQKCHSLSRDLQNNQTIIFSHLSELRLQINNFTLQLAGIQHGLHQVQEWVHDTPELAKLPKKLNALSNSVVSFGSKIQDLGATVNTLKETNARVQQDQATMLQNISSIKHAVLEISNITQRPQMLITNETRIKTDELNAAILRLNNSLIHINETLSREIKWVYDDWKKDHDLLVRLQETSQNVSMEVISLQREYAKLSEQTTILVSAQKSNDQINKMHTTDVELDGKVKNLEQLYNNLKNATDFLVAAMPEIQNHELNKGKGIEEEIHGDATTEREISVMETAPVKKASASKPKRLSVNPE